LDFKVTVFGLDMTVYSSDFSSPRLRSSFCGPTRSRIV